MAFGPGEEDLFREHFFQYMANLDCPICKTCEWQIGGPVAQLGYEEVPGIDPAGTLNTKATFPIVFLMCSKCFYVHQFAWLPLREAATAARNRG